MSVGAHTGSPLRGVPVTVGVRHLRNRRPRRGPTRLALVLLVAAPAGLWLKFGYGGPGAVWAHDYAAGVVYEVFWIALCCLAFPGWSAGAVSAGVFVCTCALEALQLWHPAWLEACRSTTVGAIVLGASFDWLDFPHYVLGAALGYAAVRWASKARC